VSVVGRAGRLKSLTLGLDGTNPRFPRKPSATMLTYRLTGTTEAIGIDHDELDQSPAPPAEPARATTPKSSPTMARLEDGAALLTCNCFGRADRI
jgi:hypothetical protein